jgi:hypothetical protein
MTVADLQKYLRGLADAIGAATKSPAKDLLDVAERLTPFAQHQFAAFAEFLKQADEFRTTGKLPEPRTKPRAVRAATPRPRTPAAPTVVKMQPAEVVAIVESLRNRALAESTLTREAVDKELQAFEKRLTSPHWMDVVKALGYKKKPGNIAEAIKTAVDYVMARKVGVERADA